MPVDLHAEMRSAQEGIRQAHLDQLRRLGVRPVNAAKLGMSQPIIGVSRIEVANDATYQLIEGGKPNAFLQPVIDQQGGIRDIVAWTPMDPKKWAWRVSDAWLMGHLPHEGSWAGADPLRVFKTPLDWLSGAGEGVCILDWKAPELRLLARFPAFVVEDPAFGRKLIEAVTRPARVPELIVSGVRHAA